jgi:hypothetical protein
LQKRSPMSTTLLQPAALLIANTRANPDVPLPRH